ncbi:alpha-mannosidase [Brochothrix campestris]|uniref:Alpha-mannosidase n=1 Tax=Brochothrix campestris FSL F6-1037 TaxID=1265861 RepID=W7CYR5_9LIST|nr:alpha-mannosidase [Brochothrix campestris]EUJ42097.1 alpha-mannosidase [Brochothrix campestris FSL F6-1037]
MPTKKVYIISHSHWDREWYLPYEQHHLRLVALIDDLLDLFKRDPDFDSFHLDGQTIILDDYLEIRPHRKDELQAAITAGKLKIGPFYILQDDFLISSESNTRNMLIGLDECQRWGAHVDLGYFPDTFGNMGQAPQMLAEAGITAAAFGRGVKPTGFDNAVISDDKYSSSFSEMWWEGADKTTIFSLLFANWYSNGNEIPVDETAAKAFWQKKLAEVEQYAATPHLLMMNGVDHQPVQQDITAAIKVANRLFPDYEFIHSNFTDYLAAVKTNLPTDLSTVSGELTSQETDGWYTLANTASTRVYLKQKNTEVQRQLENITEPLATMAASISGQYPHDELRYAWKLLMQNHPHDSICGCSVDEVHREMMTRYEKALEVGKFLASEALETLATTIDTSIFSTDERPFIVVNTAGSTKTEIVTQEIEWKRLPFSTGKPSDLHDQLMAESLPDFVVRSASGDIIPTEVINKTVRFNYDLPKDRFRQPFMAIYVTVRFVAPQLPALSWHSYALTPQTATQPDVLPLIACDARQLENETLHVKIAADGRLTVTDKRTQQIYPELLAFENVGDIGNEYIFKQANNDPILFAHENDCEAEILANTTEMATIRLTQTMRIPVSADEQLQLEMERVTDIRERLAERSKVTTPLTLTTDITLLKGSPHLQFTTNFTNTMTNHRLRVLFPTGLNVADHYTDSIYEVVKRPNQVTANWENPTNPQHQQSFINVQDDAVGITVTNYGLNEYEVMPTDNTIALTLLRAVGELGDWGYFPTPEAQCIGAQSVSYGITFHGATDAAETYQNAHAAQIPFSIINTTASTGKWLPIDSFLTIDSPQFLLTALKCKERDTAIITRGFNLNSSTESDFKIDLPQYSPQRCNLVEQVSNIPLKATLDPAEICSIIWNKDS